MSAVDIYLFSTAKLNHAWNSFTGNDHVYIDGESWPTYPLALRSSSDSPGSGWKIRKTIEQWAWTNWLFH